MHLMTFIQSRDRRSSERLLIVVAQGIFYSLFFLLYLVSARTAHRVVATWKRKAVYS